MLCFFDGVLTKVNFNFLLESEASSEEMDKDKSRQGSQASAEEHYMTIMQEEQFGQWPFDTFLQQKPPAIYLRLSLFCTYIINDAYD